MLSAQEFVAMARALAVAAPGEWEYRKETVLGQEHGYLVAREKKLIRCRSIPTQQSQSDICEVKDELEGEVMEAEALEEELEALALADENGGSQAQWCSNQYHVVYHPTYRVPALLFESAFLDGSPLSTDQVLANCEAATRTLPSGTEEADFRPEDWAFVTQQQHPVLARPFFALHPCKTAGLMNLVLGCASSAGEATEGERPKPGHAPEHYLVVFLSLLGRAIGLDVPVCPLSVLARDTKPNIT